ncbi:hypothetical protein [Candidatus Amarolinea dominans]|uniref:hypothetical protein n=1 Tax=Candidatus Amarolinea dominans TaxID=3140696 RepID=UPI003136F9D3|nr:hypothetical protein [Anaerolineae bacterium]
MSAKVEQVFEIVENQQEFVRLKEFTELRFGDHLCLREGSQGTSFRRDLYATEEMDFGSCIMESPINDL